MQQLLLPEASETPNKDVYNSDIAILKKSRAMSSSHDKKARAVRVTGKSPIATPPRAALSGRSKTDHHDDNASTKSTKSTPDTNASDNEDGDSESTKDKKIAELEKEMATMEDEFERELTQLSHKLTNESETAIFWQQKHSTLNQTFLKTDTDLRLLRQEVHSFHAGREERDRDIKTRISSLMLDRDAFREAYNEAMGEMRAKDDMIKALQGQVWGLKSFVSASSKMDEQVTDEAFGERMQRLGNGLQNWVITNFRRAKIDSEKANDEIRDRLLRLVPTYEALATTSKVHLIQSIVSRLLVDRVFHEYFIGLSKQHGEDLKRVGKHLCEFGSAESMNQWRSTTLAILRKEAPQKLHTETTAVVENIVTEVNIIMGSISDLQTSETRDQSLRALINSSIELSRLLRVQKAVFSVTMPSIEEYQKTMFDAASMEDIGGEDEDTLEEREIRCVTFPGIIKNGDENGEREHLRNVVAKIRVLCAPD